MADPYAHADYRSFVRAWLADHPKRSQRWLAKQLDVKPPLVSMILSGQRDLNLQLARRLGEALGLEGEELTYLEALVRADDGPTAEIRRAARHLADALRDFAALRAPEPAHHEWFGSWVHLAILGLAGFDGFLATPEWIAPRLWPEVEPEVVRVAVEELVSGGVLTRTEDGWHVDPTPLGTGRRIAQPELARAARRLHQDQLRHAAQALDTFGADQRLAASVSLAIAEDQLPALMTALNRFHLDLVQPFREGAPEQIVEVLVALFPRSRAP
jgi:uncharacterized protein (TIGR02147 family)